MAMGTRDPEQPPLWIAASDLPVSPGHPFYTRLNALLDADGFDTFVEDACRSFYAPVLGRRVWRPVATSACCWLGTSKASIRSAASRGVRRTRWRCGASCDSGWRRRPRITRRFRAPAA